MFRSLPVRDSPPVTGPADPSSGSDGARFPPSLMYAAATLYYLEDATQAEVAERLGTSRPTVSRLLSEARRHGIVRIDVRAPIDVDAQALATQVADALGLAAVHLAPAVTPSALGVSLAPAVEEALRAVALEAGDVVLVSSGRTVYESSQARLPRLPGVIVAPTVGGQDEPEPWYQTNEITRQVAAKLGGRPVFLYAPALPSAALHERLLEDDSTRAVLSLWERARCALLGVGAPPSTRQVLPGFVRGGEPWLREAAGDICARFYDSSGEPLAFPGAERLIATSVELLRRIPATIALAVGAEKIPSLIAGARAGWFNRLVTDVPTAEALVRATERAA